MVVVGFPVVFILLIVVKILTERIVAEFPPFTVVYILTLSTKVLRVKNMIHKISGQDIVATKQNIQNVINRHIILYWSLN